MAQQLEDHRFVHEQKTHHEKLIVEIFTFSIIASAALLGYGLNIISQTYAAFVVFAPIAIVIPCALVMADTRRAIFSLEAYIRVFLESEDKPGYETRLESKRRIDEGEKSWLCLRCKESFNYFFFTYWFLWMISTALFTWRVKVTTLCDYWIILVGIAFLCLAFINCWFFRIPIRANRERLEHMWRRTEATN